MLSVTFARSISCRVTASPSYVILAEGLAAESYLDTGKCTAFSGGGAYVDAYPDFAAKHWQGTCIPLIVDGEPLIRVRARFIERAQQVGYSSSQDADLHPLADQRRIEPSWHSPDRVSFTLPVRFEHIELRCGAARRGGGAYFGLVRGREQRGWRSVALEGRRAATPEPLSTVETLAERLRKAYGSGSDRARGQHNTDLYPT